MSSGGDMAEGRGRVGVGVGKRAGRVRRNLWWGSFRDRDTRLVSAGAFEAAPSPEGGGGGGGGGGGTRCEVRFRAERDEQGRAVVERDGWMGGGGGSKGGKAWRPLETVDWEGALDAGRSSCVVSGGSSSALGSLSPVWRLLLLSDGSMTRHLNALLSCGPNASDQEEEEEEGGRRSGGGVGSGIGVDVIAQEPIGEGLEGLPPAVQLIRGPRVQRQVWLTDREAGAGDEGRRLVYACSWWNQAEIEDYLKEQGVPMWASLQNKHVELYREVRKLYLGRAPDLAADFLRGSDADGAADSPQLWARHYVFYLGGRPLTVVYECFSPRLAEIAGPQHSHG